MAYDRLSNVETLDELITSDGSAVANNIEMVRQYQASTWADPIGWSEHALNTSLWDKQGSILTALRDNTRVCVRSGHGVGKSRVAAVATHWFLHSHCPGYVVTTASSWRGVYRVIWPEIHRLNYEAPVKLGGRLIQCAWELGPLWGAFGVSADQPENFAGFHNAGGVLVIVDEASGISEAIMEAIEGVTAGAHCRILMLGNPLRPVGPFYETFKSPYWKSIHISTLDVPNVVEDNDALVPGLATRTWVAEQGDKWGKDSPAYQARILGEFPSVDEVAVVPWPWCEAAMARDVSKLSKDDFGPLCMGVDVARFGSDRTVLAIRDNKLVRHLIEVHGDDTMQTAGRIQVVAKQHKIPARLIYVDDGGLGGGVTDRLRELGFYVKAVNFARRPYDTELYANVRAEAYWTLRQAIEPGGKVELAIPGRFKNLASECSMAHFAFTSRGKIKLEEKEEIRKRLGRSPDLADALALTYAVQRGKAYVV